MLIDRAILEVRSGRGGPGAISFLQDRQTTKGGPDGGNGGPGGSVILVAQANVNTLFNFRHSKVIIALDGSKGDREMMNGRAAEDVYVDVPVGTVVYLESDGSLVADLKHDRDFILVAQGGRGGRGNACFKNARQRIPQFAENGFPGEKRRLILELKMLADVGIVGFPSVGKSTLLNVVSRANVPTADYPFTTIVPNLGVVNLKDGREFVLADMPGLIAGAHEGKGLGLQFLRHIERCRVLIHMVSMSGERDPYEDYRTIREELKDYGANLEKRPEIIVAAKMDEEGAAERKALFDKKTHRKSIGVSALTHEGINELMKKAADLIAITPEFPIKGINANEGGLKIYDAHKDAKKLPYVIYREGSGIWRIKGREVEKQYTNFDTATDEGLAKLVAYLDKIGINEQLKESGAKTGDTVRLVDYEFEYDN